jgi:hypothetical protein
LSRLAVDGELVLGCAHIDDPDRLDRSLWQLGTDEVRHFPGLDTALALDSSSRDARSSRSQREWTLREA